MLDAPQITQSTTQLMAFIHLTIPRAEIRNVMGPGLGELKAALAAQGVTATGPWFTHHLKMDPGIFDFEICLPVSAPVSAAGRVKAGQLPAKRVRADRLSRTLRRARPRLGRVRWLDQGQRPQARGGSVGGLSRRAGVGPRSGAMAHRVESTIARLSAEVE
jgi:hypothetical protein